MWKKKMSSDELTGYSQAGEENIAEEGMKYVDKVYPPSKVWFTKLPPRKNKPGGYRRFSPSQIQALEDLIKITSKPTRAQYEELDATYNIRRPSAHNWIKRRIKIRPVLSTSSPTWNCKKRPRRILHNSTEAVLNLATSGTSANQVGISSETTTNFCPVSDEETPLSDLLSSMRKVPVLRVTRSVVKPKKEKRKKASKKPHNNRVKDTSDKVHPATTRISVLTDQKYPEIKNKKKSHKKRSWSNKKTRKFKEVKAPIKQKGSIKRPFDMGDNLCVENSTQECRGSNITSTCLADSTSSPVVTDFSYTTGPTLEGIGKEMSFTSVLSERPVSIHPTLETSTDYGSSSLSRTRSTLSPINGNWLTTVQNYLPENTVHSAGTLSSANNLSWSEQEMLQKYYSVKSEPTEDDVAKLAKRFVEVREKHDQIKDWFKNRRHTDASVAAYHPQDPPVLDAIENQSPNYYVIADSFQQQFSEPFSRTQTSSLPEEMPLLHQPRIDGDSVRSLHEGNVDWNNHPGWSSHHSPDQNPSLNPANNVSGNVPETINYDIELENFRNNFGNRPRPASPCESDSSVEFIFESRPCVIQHTASI